MHSRLLNSLLQASKKSPSLLGVLSHRAYPIGYCSRNFRLPKPFPEGRSPPDGSVLASAEVKGQPTRCLGEAVLSLLLP